MNKKIILAVAIPLAVALTITVNQLDIGSGTGYTPVVYEVVRDASGYQPTELTINLGDTVRFINNSSDYHWPASDLHPTHGVYPDFDPRRPITTDEVWEFSFDKTGEWKYHDHLRANKTGTISVRTP